MKKSIVVVFLFMSLVGVLISLSLGQAAETFPSRPISLLVGTSPGATLDTSVRALAEPAAKKLGQPIIIVNKAGAGGTMMMNEMKVTKPDGYTVSTMMTGNIVNPHLLKVPYHPINDFDPLLRYSFTPQGLIVLPDSPFKTFKDFITYAKDNPNKVKYSTSGIGYPMHLVMLQLAEVEKVKWTHVPFDGGQEAIAALLGGHVDCSSSTSAFKPFVESSRLRLLATYGEKRMDHYLNVPTLIELGYNITALSGFFIIGPKGIPKDRLKMLHDAFYEGMQDLKFKKALERLDMPWAYLDTENSKKAIEDMFETSGKLLKKIGKK